MTEITKEIKPEDYGLTKKTTEEFFVGLKPIKDERKLLIKRFEEIQHLEITPENIKKFRELRLDFQKNRTRGILTWHKSVKEIPLRTGQLIDAIKRNEENVNLTYEEKLESSEKFLENQEKERKEKLHTERLSKIEKYLENITALNLSEMEEDEFEIFFTGAKARYEAKIEAERKAEQERLEQVRKETVLRNRMSVISQFGSHATYQPHINMEEVDWQNLLSIAEKNKKEYDDEQERIRLENARLKKEAEEKEKELEEQRKKALAEQKAMLEKAKQKEAELERQRQEELRIEHEKQAELEAKLKAKQEAEERAELERQKQEERLKKEKERLEKAPIVEQMTSWVNDFRLPETHLKSDTIDKIQNKFEDYIKWCHIQIKNYESTES